MERTKATALQILDIVCDPASAFRLIRSDAYSIPLLLAVVLAFEMFLQSYEVHRAALVMTATVSPRAAAMVAKVQILYLVVQPFILIARWGIIAFLLWTGAMLISTEVPFLRVFALTVTLQIVSVLHRSAQLVVAVLSNAAPTTSLREVGLNLLVHPNDPVLRTLANLANPFSLWYAALMLFGVAYVMGRNARQAVPAVAPYLCFVLIAEIGMAMAVPGRA